MRSALALQHCLVTRNRCAVLDRGGDSYKKNLKLEDAESQVNPHSTIIALCGTVKQKAFRETIQILS